MSRTNSKLGDDWSILSFFDFLNCDLFLDELYVNDKEISDWRQKVQSREYIWQYILMDLKNLDS